MVILGMCSSWVYHIKLKTMSWRLMGMNSLWPHWRYWNHGNRIDVTIPQPFPKIGGTTKSSIYIIYMWLYVYMYIYIQIYANKPCLCEAFYIKTMVFLCGDMQALLISERQNQKLYWQSHSVEAFQGYTILVYGIFYLFSFRLTFIKII